MTAIILPRQHYTQPQGCLTVASNWDAGLVTAFTGGNSTDVFGRSIIPVNNPTIVSGFSGQGLQTNGSNNYGFIAIPQTNFFEATILCLSEPSVLNTNRGTIQVASSVSTNPIISIRTGSSNSSRVRRWVRSDSNGALNNTSDSTLTAFALGRESLIGIRLRVEAGSPNPIHSIWVDGVADDLQVGTISPGYTCDRVGIGALVFKNGNFDFFNGRTYFAAVFSRALDDDEMRELAANPYQIFRANPVRIYSLGDTPTQSSVVSSITSNFNVNTFTQSDVGLSSYINSSVESETEVTYILRTSAVASSAIDYLVNTTVGSNEEIDYQVRLVVLSDKELSSSVNDSAISSNLIDYNIRSSVVGSSAIQYNLLGAISEDKLLEYVVNSSIQSDSYHSYEITSASIVANNLSLSYNVNTSLVKDLITSYNTRVGTSSDKVLEYSVRDSTYVDRTVAFNVRNITDSSAVITYNIENTLSVVNDILTSYDVKSLVSNDSTFTYVAGYEINSKFSSYSVKQETQVFTVSNPKNVFIVTNSNNNSYTV